MVQTYHKLWLDTHPQIDFALSLGQFLMLMFFIFFLFLSIRSSVDRKDYHYFYRYLIYFPVTMIIFDFFLLTPFVFVVILCAVSPLFAVHYSSLIYLGVPAVLFWLDSYKGWKDPFKAWGKAVLFMLYNSPFFLVTFALFIGLNRLVWMLFDYCPDWIVPFKPFLLYHLLAPVTIVVGTVLYLKRIHEQFNLYF